MKKILKSIIWFSLFFSFWGVFADSCPISSMPKDLEEYVEDTNFKKTYIMWILTENARKKQVEESKNWSDALVPFKTKIREAKAKSLEAIRSVKRDSDLTEVWINDVSFWSNYDVDYYFWVYSGYIWKDYPDEVWRDYNEIENLDLSLSNAISVAWDRGFDLKEIVDFWEKWKDSLLSLKDKNEILMTEFKKHIIKWYWFSPNEKTIDVVNWVDLRVYLQTWKLCERTSETESFWGLLDRVSNVFDDTEWLFDEWNEWYAMYKWLSWNETAEYRKKEMQILRDRIWEFWVNQKQAEKIFNNLRNYNWKNPVVWDKNYNDKLVKSNASWKKTQESLLSWAFWLITWIWQRTIESSYDEFNHDISTVKKFATWISERKKDTDKQNNETKSWNDKTSQENDENLEEKLKNMNTFIDYKPSEIKAFKNISKLDFSKTKDEINRLYQREKLSAKSATSEMNSILRKIIKMNIQTSSWIKALSEAIKSAEKSCNAQWTWSWRCSY